MDEPTCPGCAVRDHMIAYLQQRESDLQDRLLAVSNPAGYQVYKGVNGNGAEAPPTAEQAFTDAEGVDWVWVGGQKVRRDEVVRMQEKLEAQMSGRASDAILPEL